MTITNAEGESDAVLRVEISAPATLAYAARSLTTDYALRLDAPAVDPAVAAEDARNARDGFVAEIAAGDFDWFSNDDNKIFGGTSLDWDGDGIDNPYDWTPTSVLIDGRLVSVNLTLSLTGEFGTAGNPWPIYNVWQLQAIEGVSVSHDGTQSGNLTLFGGGNARVAAQYRLATNIDATRRNNGKPPEESRSASIPSAAHSVDFLTAAVMRCGGFSSIDGALRLLEREIESGCLGT